MIKAVKLLRVFLCAVLIILTGTVVYYNEALPDSYLVSPGGSLYLGNYVEISAEEIMPQNYDIQNYGTNDHSVCAINGEASLNTGFFDSSNARAEQLSLFGIFPIKAVTVREVDEPVVVPCGTPFGIKIITEGVLVVELTGFDSGGELKSPAKDAGLSEGDIIVSISGKKVFSNSDVSRIIESSGGKTLGVEYIREGKNMLTFIHPGLSVSDGCYRAGMWVRDSTAGIGTVTFYDPATGVFAGLGHPVCDADTGDVLTLSQGEAADVVIRGIKKSEAGAPGELIGMFAGSDSSGELLYNGESGLYGVMAECPAVRGAVRVAMRQEIEEGPAFIYATVDGRTPQLFQVEIEKITLSDSDNSHDMVVHVTDEELIEKAGGIVQGMSGSPIIQNGKLVGAITHVLVRDPTRGYAIFADTMLETAEQVASQYD